MENTCSQYLFLFLLSLSTSPPPPVEASSDILRSVQMHLTALPWKEAKQYCRAVKGELAIQRDAPDILSFSKICNDKKWKCWVGLRDREKNGWTWINGPNLSLLDTNWAAKHPGDNGCGAVTRGQLVGDDCEAELYFLCEHYLVLEEEKTWEEALDHCRALEPDASDLLSFHNKAELSHTQDEMVRAQTEEVWIGLRWLAGRWLWMDRTAGGVISLPECPANGNHCGTLSGRGQQARSCVEKRRFFCWKQAY